MSELTSGATLEKFSYDNKIVKYFGAAAIIWGIIGMIVGLLAAVQLFLPEANLGTPYTTFGRIRPLHTNAVIFAFVGNAIFAGVYYSMPRLLKAPMWKKWISWFHFWGWQLVIVLAVVTLLLGFTSSKEYAELEWPIDILLTLVWVAFGANMIGTLLTRRERHMYVAIWFYLASFVTVAVLHIFNSLALPVSFMKSYSAYAGVQDALVQWWYGHNAVAFFLTTPYLGLMYYFLPKAANRPVYSYKLSIIHFWALIFIYIWAGPHHLLYTALPEWAQVLGTAFSVMLLAPSWAGMINGLLTLRGAWDKVRVDPILKFMLVAVTAYGMATFEGPLLSLKNVNAIAHYTDWIVAHVHIGALGWNGFLTFGMLYWLWPRMWKTTLYSTKLANTHFWLGTLGIIFYALPMYVSALTQSLMWQEFNEMGRLAYPNFLETVIEIVPMYMLRALGGAMYLSGVFILVYNLVKTAKQGRFVAEEHDEAPALAKHVPQKDEFWHRVWERKPVFFTLMATAAIVIGGLVEIVPTIMIKSNVPTISSVQPYTPLELQGRDLYIANGCVGCHSQMIRPFRSETERYGEYSKAGEYIYDRPFLWGSKRTGPDLHRVGGKYPDSWHYHHMYDPRSMSPGSLMPPYPWMTTNLMDHEDVPAKIRTLQKLGVPYPEGYDQIANEDLDKQAAQIVASLKESQIDVMPNAEIVALIAYLQRLGTDIKKVQTVENQ
ncbi:MAG TPA: cytochrome-c oxidase, cbb3-type subunit I [Cyclobacteriaceae bacterium]|nr:cytochrome-c oxidase, cbb3-type subunit I [Cyclobacteriaceae bacterium]